jgi:hypothetical protein
MTKTWGSSSICKKNWLRKRDLITLIPLIAQVNQAVSPGFVVFCPAIPRSAVVCAQSGLARLFGLLGRWKSVGLVERSGTHHAFAEQDYATG